jgi:hypothetical protein
MKKIEDYAYNVMLNDGLNLATDSEERANERVRELEAISDSFKIELITN